MRAKLYRGRWYAVWIEGGKTRRTALRAADREAAERNLSDLKRALTVEAKTVAEIMKAYLADREGRASHESMRYAWQALQRVFGHLRPDQITRDLCRDYVTRRRQSAIKDGTIIKELSVLRAGMKWQTKATPAVIEVPPQPAPRARYLTREEYRRLRDAAKMTPHLHLFVILAYTTAGRASAILELTWDQIDFPRGIIRLGDGQKRQKGRATVPMTDSARTALEEAKRAAVTDYVIEYGGKRVLSVKKAFGRAVDRAELEDVSPHILRHSAAVHMAESGVPMSEIAQYLGHSRTAVTERVYGRYSPDYLRKAAGALE